MTRQSAVILTVFVLALAGCYVPSPKLGRTETLQQQIGLAGAESVSVSVVLGVGKLKLAGGGDSLLDAEFMYNIPDWKPVVSYDVEDGRGRLVVAQPSRVVGATWPGNVRYNWDLKLNPEVPLDLEVDMGVGKSEVSLSGLNLSRLSIEAGVGEGMVDLSGIRPSDLDATIKAGVCARGVHVGAPRRPGHPISPADHRHLERLLDGIARAEAEVAEALAARATSDDRYIKGL